MKNRQVEKIDIFISSPGDVSRERKIAQKVIADLNKLPHISSRFTLNALVYEDTVPPGMGENAQLMVDHYMMEAEKADILVCILWSRMGTPVYDPTTGKSYPSGTAYEFSQAYEAYQKCLKAGIPPRPRMLLYRDKKRMPAAVDLVQLSRVNAFFEQIIQGEFQGLFAQYKSNKAFEEMLRHDLLTVIEKDFVTVSSKLEIVEIKPLTVVDVFAIDSPDALDTLLGKASRIVGREALLQGIPERLRARRVGTLASPWWSRKNDACPTSGRRLACRWQRECAVAKSRRQRRPRLI